VSAVATPTNTLDKSSTIASANATESGHGDASASGGTASGATTRSMAIFTAFGGLAVLLYVLTW
jgi:hypothetical protein